MSLGEVSQQHPFILIPKLRFIPLHFQALRRSLKPDSKVLSKLQGEVDSLHGERREVSLHIERTESWAEHLGKWRCHVKSVEHGTAAAANGGGGVGAGGSAGTGAHLNGGGTLC